MTLIEIEVFEALRRTLAEAAPDALPALLGRLEEEPLRGENRLTALVVNGNGRTIGPALDAPDENISVQEAARRLGISKRWLYRNSDRVPFTVRIGRRVVFSAHKVSGHKTRSMLDRYNIVEETETAAALVKADAYLSTQPTERNVAALEHAQNAHSQVSRRKAR